MPIRRKPAPLAAQLGRRLRQLRIEKGFTVEKLVWESEIGGKGFLSEAERGLSLPSLVTLEKLADALDIDLVDLINSPRTGPRSDLIESSRFLSDDELKESSEALRKKVGAIPAPHAGDRDANALDRPRRARRRRL